MLGEFEALLKASIGLDAASIGTAAIERAIHQRRVACALPDLYTYWQHLQSSEDERQTLIEAVVVSETWFFRHEEAFPQLVTLMRDVWLRGTAVGTLQLLSLPCSTGEEPYSMAMALLDGGIPPERFRIDAIDISDRALALAREGIYGRNSFRGADVAFRDRHFERRPHAWRISEAVRRQVQFRRDNLFAPDILAAAGDRYDAIFCRNVLIYFDRETQDRAIGVLTRLLKPTGILFVAPAEASLPPAQAFAPAAGTAAFTFHRRAHRPPARPSVAATIVVHPPAHSSTDAPRRKGARAGPPATPASAPASAFAPTSASSLASAARPPSAAAGVAIAGVAGLLGTADPADALRLADQGHFAEAASYCDAYLRAQGPSADAFYVLGLVRDATGNQGEAEAFYRKALYLDPSHHEALMQLALVIETRGDRAGAQVLRQRARRVEREQLRARG